MWKPFPPVLALVLLFLSVAVECKAQNAQLAAREAEWESYALPSTKFVRWVDPASSVLARVPADWKAQPVKTSESSTAYGFIGPDSTTLQISIEKIPDGWPLLDYVAVILQRVRNLPGISDSLLVRRTELSGLDAREILFEVPDEKGILSRRLIWCVVDGPTAVAVVLVEPLDHSVEIEPQLRAVTESLIVPVKDAASEALRSEVMNEVMPARVNEVLALVRSVNGLDVADRDKAIAKLATMFSSAPESVIDLLMDRRPMVRAAAVDAIAQSKNRAFDRYVLQTLHDRESYVSARSARSVAQMPNVIAALRDETFDWLDTETIARVWFFLDKGTRLKILAEVFSGTPRRPAPGPAKAASHAQGAKATRAEPNSELGLLTLLDAVPAKDFKLPLAQILAGKNDALTAAALQMSFARGDTLSVAELFKLLSAPAPEVRRLAALNLGETAALNDISQLEEVAKRIAPANSAPPGEQTQNDTRLADTLRDAIKKIRLRDQLTTAMAETRQQLLKQALADPQLADWVWSKYIEQEVHLTTGDFAAARQVSPLGENVFPERVTNYVAIPNPSRLFQRLGDSLNGIQMDSARAQANLVLMRHGITAKLTQELGAKRNDSLFEFSGLKSGAPIALASWTATGAPQGIASAQRKAIILRAADRERFERLLALYQKNIGNFASLPEYVSGGAHFLAAFPAILPLSADMILKDTPSAKKELPILTYDFVAPADLDAYPAKAIVQRRVSAQGIVTVDVAYLSYVGDAAVLTPNLASMSDVLRRLSKGGPALATSADFKSAAEGDGDAVYFTDLEALFGAPGAIPGPPVKEIGALKISNNAWESSYRLTFDESDWSKPLASFQPGDLSAPRELLPRSTVVYYFMKIDLAAAWRSWLKAFASLDDFKSLTAVLALDLEREVLPAFDTECGVALLGLPDAAAKDFQVPWVAFCKLKNDKLQKALDDNRLFKNAVTKQGVATIKIASKTVVASIRNGYLVISDTEASLRLLDQKEKLVASRDFAKAIKRAPAGVVGFGGYNLETSSSSQGASSDSVRAQQASVILSLTRAFHSPSFYAIARAGSVEARSSISLDREGRYPIAELQSLAVNSEPTFVVLQPTGLPIVSQDRIKSLKLKIQARAAGEVEHIAEDLGTDYQTVESRSAAELQLRVRARRSEDTQQVDLPITSAEFAPFLQPTKEIRSDDKGVSERAREIAGADRSALSVARKLAEWTYKNLTWKRVDEADAAETLATREADCYEFSKLYVAMARSLGLPARVVSGLAYSGSAFGGHAWVEVYVGTWIELDPTWGTDFVDATHVRDTSGTLLTYAALNLIALEVMEAPRGVEEFQLDPSALVKKLCEELPDGRTGALKAALDVTTLAEDAIGAGAWSTMSDAERTQMSGAYQRVLTEISVWLKKSEQGGGNLRLLSIKVSGERAQALMMHSLPANEMLIRTNLVRRDGAWLLAEMVQTDTGLKVISETLQPTIREILERRSGQKTLSARQSDFSRVLSRVDSDPKQAIELADIALKKTPGARDLRYLKSLALSNAEQDAEAIKLWTELSNEQPPLPIALLTLARHYESSEDVADQQKAIEPYRRYIAAEPDDPRAHTNLASLYDSLKDYSHAEAEYRAAIECDNLNSDPFVDLAAFQAQQKRFAEAAATIDEAVKRTGSKDDLFGYLMFRFTLGDDAKIPEGLAASQPQRMARSALANLHLGQIRIDDERGAQAIPLLRKAAGLDKKWADPYDLLSEVYRKLHNWSAALLAANTAIRLNAEDGDAHYERACSLARLGRRREAVTALKRSVELNPSLAGLIVDELDLKSLAALAEFRKLIPKPEK